MFPREDLQNLKAHSTKFLNYGHLGTITYNEEDRTWQTSRIIEPHVEITGHTTAAKGGRLAFPLRHLSSTVVYDGFPAFGIESETQTTDTEVGNVSDSNFGLSRKSSFTVETENGFRSKHDATHTNPSTLARERLPNRSALLAFGSAVSTVSRRLRSESSHVPIAVSVSGNSAQCLRMARIEAKISEGFISDGDRGSLDVPYISYKDQAYWTSSGESIEQVCCAAPCGYSSTFLAARLQSSTKILHPHIRSEAVPARCERPELPFPALPSSVLDTNPIATIPISRTGGHPHADVSFHPQDHSRLALIDEHGNWSVWLVVGKRQEGLRFQFSVTLVCFGKIWTWDHEKRLRASLPYYDGWHRISWCTSSKTHSEKLFVCNRRLAAVYETSGDLFGFNRLQLGHARENELILDVLPSRHVLGHFFVLTSTQLFWLCVVDTESGNSPKQQDIPHVLLAWQHFRDREDSTLHLVVLETGLSTPHPITRIR